MSGGSKFMSHPVFRLFGVAVILWLGVVFFSHGIFHQYNSNQTDYGVHPKELHPAGDFLRNAKSLSSSRGAKSIGQQQLGQQGGVVDSGDMGESLEAQAEKACSQSMHADYIAECLKDVQQLNNMNPPVAHHYVRMLSSRAASSDLLKGKAAEHPCMSLTSETHRADCYKTVLATSDFAVAQKISVLIHEKELREPGGVTLHDAKIACALTKEKGMCIHDVMGTGDLDTAEIYDKMKAPRKDAKTGKLAMEAQHHSIQKADAVQACKMVHPDDREYCQSHVMQMGDEETAEHYVHLLQDSEEHLSQNLEGVITKEEGVAHCESLKDATHQQQCLKDIWVLPNRHVADHFIELYDQLTAVSETQAEKLCNHLSRSHHNHETCIETLTKMSTGAEAASHYSALLQHQRIQLATQMEDSKPSLTKAQATQVCQDVKNAIHHTECLTDVTTMNDLVPAQQYAQMLLETK